MGFIRYNRVMSPTVQTLCIIRHEGRILLGRKKRGLGAGKWTGIGGHVEEGETVEQAAIREVKEEIRVQLDAVERVGLGTFSFPTRGPIELHIFKATKFQGEPVETDEMTPAWFTKDTLPFSEMWSSDLYWWPYFLKNRLFVGTFDFDEHDRVISREVRIVTELP